MPCPAPKPARCGGAAPRSQRAERPGAPGLSPPRGRGGAERLARGAPGQVREVAVDDTGALAPLVDRPHDQGLAAAGVARGEDALRPRRVRAGLRVAAPVALHPELLEQRRLGVEEAHGEQDELRRPRGLRTRDRVEGRLPRVLDPVDLLHATVAPAQLGGGDGEVLLAALLDGVAATQLHGPARPRREVVGARGGRLAEQLDLRHRGRALAVGVADAVRAGVAAADDDHVLARRADPRLALAAAGHPPVATGEVVHREVHAVELAPGNGEGARHARAGGDHDRVVALAQLVGADVDPDVDPVLEAHALGRELVEAPLDHPLLDLEVRNAEADQAAAGLVALVDRHRVAAAAQLLRGREAGRARADDRDAAAALEVRRPRRDPALVNRAVDDRDLDLLDRDRVALADLEHAGGLARRGAQLAGELGEVVGRVQLVDRLAPAVAVHEVVPVRDQVAERAAVVTERHPALHAARALLLELGHGERVDELAVVRRALARVALGVVDARNAEEGAELAHQTATSAATKPSPPVDSSASASASSRSARL